MKCIVFLVNVLLCQMTAGYGYHNNGHGVRRHDGLYFDNKYQEDYFGQWDANPAPRVPSYRHTDESSEDIIGEGSGEEPSRPKYSGNNYLLPNWMQMPWTTTTRRPTTTERKFSSAELTAACIRSCPVTSEYNPVCGTDNVTYQNRGRLECAQNCGVRVKLSRLSSCSVPAIPTEPTTVTTSTTTPHNDWQTTITTTESSYINNNGNDRDNNKNENTGNKDNDEIQNNGNPDKSNGANNDNKNNNNDRNSCNSNTKKTSVEEVMACTQLCPLSSEYNPVCGTDGITYSNPGRLLCSQYCGIDVKVKKFAPCSSNIPTNIYTNCQCPTFTNPPVTDSPATPTTPSFAKSCLEACPASLAFSPVCGTDNVTYQNLDKLNCAKRCGIEVGLQSMSSCADAGTNVAPLVRPTDPAIPSPVIEHACIKQCSVNTKYEPICGTDNITYNNTGHLICARQCGKAVEIKSQSACPDRDAPPTSTERPKVTPNPYPNGLNFTIPPDVLASIFPEDTKQGDDSDENIDIDKRFKEENNQTVTRT